MALGLGQRFRIIRKLLTQKDPYIFIALKPPEMVRPRGPDYVYAGLAQRFREEQAAYIANFKEIEGFARADSLKACQDAAEGATFKNGYFSGHDARTAYAMVRRFAPRRIVEIGSGFSTHFLRKAVDDQGLATRIVCIDPAPRASLGRAADEFVQRNFVDTAPDLFAGLAANDMVFLDGSHYAFNGTDVPHFFLNALPILPLGVLVHIHDIMLPYEYDALFTARHYNEQYLLGALLAHSPFWEIVLPLHYMWRQGLIDGAETALSFWLRRR